MKKTIGLSEDDFMPGLYFGAILFIVGCFSMSIAVCLAYH